MSISAHHQKMLLRSIAIIKPNFHCFTVTFHMQLKRHALTMQWPSSDEISEKVICCIAHWNALLPT
ncbi:hypothetical protein H5187_13410 [Pseudoalteromonas sp. SG44-1]|uniref:hypothetical protein n=1 Tax=Pseudoalteromonas sp. SG44-1 TaxID=2760964 RepID=UPI0016013C38|nr:hypothetical protein [Pseudoalteromonas sp. SG44-1]MBB1418280.1 hypothetical protein [Pseudoalteromonas sp. SG44-1]